MLGGFLAKCEGEERLAWAEFELNWGLETQRVLGLLEVALQAFLHGVEGAVLTCLLEFLQELFLPGVELGGGQHVDEDNHVALLPAADDGHALPADAQGGAALDALGDGDGELVIDAGNGNLGAEGRLHEADLGRIDEILALALIDLALLDVEDDEEVAGWTAVEAALALAAHAQARAGVDACRDAQVEFSVIDGISWG